MKYSLPFNCHCYFDPSVPFSWVVWFLGSAGSIAGHFEHVLEWWHGGSGRSRWSLWQCSWVLRAFMKCVRDLAVYVYPGKGTYRGLRKSMSTGISRWEDHCIKMGAGTYPPLFHSAPLLLLPRTGCNLLVTTLGVLSQDTLDLNPGKTPATLCRYEGHLFSSLPWDSWRILSFRQSDTIWKKISTGERNLKDWAFIWAIQKRHLYNIT